MKKIEWIIVSIGIILIIVHGFWPDLFRIDLVTILIFFVLSFPFTAKYLRKAKILGAEFEFNKEIIETEKLVDISTEKAKKDKSFGKTKTLPFRTFELSTVRDLLNSDHVLALAALRIEIERKLRLVADMLELSVNDKLAAVKLIDVIKDKKMLSSEQTTALKKILNMCNKAIHGFTVSEENARKVIDLAEELNETFSMGYFINFSPNLNYEEQGQICEWEHCIEWMPLSEKRTERSCSIFGHNCPGGAEKVSKCDKTISDKII